MFGTYRFALSLTVAAAHMSLVSGFRIGAVAIICFYILSGYVMTHSFFRYFDQSPRKIAGFFLDRILRIYPVYLFSLALIIGFFFLTGVPKYVENGLEGVNVFRNFTLLPSRLLALPSRYVAHHSAGRLGGVVISVLPPASLVAAAKGAKNSRAGSQSGGFHPWGL